MIVVYGIPNCDTVKKARRWLDAHAVPYQFHDYKKAGAPNGRLEAWCDQLGWEKLINRAGTTFRKLPDSERAALDRAKAVRLMLAQPSMIRRPIVEYPGGLLAGFDPDHWQQALFR